jgi:hypothetical protein
MQGHDEQISLMRLKISLLLTVRNCMRVLAIWGFALGVFVLVGRVLLQTERSELAWAAVTAVPFVFGSMVYSVRKTPSEKSLTCLFDERNRCGGLLIARSEVDLGGWRVIMPQVRSPRLGWRSGSTVLPFLLAACFVAVSFLIPQKYVTGKSHRRLQVGDDIQKIEEQIKALEEEDALSEEESLELREKLRQLTETASGYDPVRTWESLDHLRESLEKRAAEAANEAIQQTEGLTEAETLAKALSANPGAVDEALLNEAMEELASMVDELSRSNTALKDALDAQALNVTGSQQLTEEQMEALLKALAEGKVQLQECVGGMCKYGLVDPNAVGLCEGMAQCDASGLLAYLKEHSGEMGIGEALKSYCQGPGRGGVNRGRGDAEMVYGDQSSETGTKFEEQSLPAARLSAMKDSHVVGTSVSAPQLSEGQDSGDGGALDSAQAGAGSAQKRKILPKHNNAVKRYFEKE